MRASAGTGSSGSGSRPWPVSAAPHRSQLAEPGSFAAWHWGQLNLLHLLNFGGGTELLPALLGAFVSALGK